MATSAALLLFAKVTVVASAGWVAVRVTRRQRAAVRHVLLAATFGIAIALPFVSLIAPAISVRVPVAVPPGTPPVIVDPPIDRDAAKSMPPEDIAARQAIVVAAPTVSWTAIFLAVWFGGAVVGLLPVVVGLQQVRALRRSGHPCARGQSIADGIARAGGITRSIDVRVHELTPGPLTFGVIRPAIMLPPDAHRWSDNDLRRAVIHELEHVRRHDWLTQCVARVACAGYWCHPLIWIVRRRFALEAERACDDAVLISTSLSSRRDAATAYADQLVDLATRLSAAARQPLLAMANRADLSTRVAALLDRRQPRGRAGNRWITTVTIAASALLFGLSPLRLVAAVQSSPTGTASTAKQRYDVATVKPCVAEPQPTGARGTYGGTNATFSPGRFNVPCVTTGQLIYLAYAAAGVSVDERLVNDDPGTAASAVKVRGGPDWVHSLRDKYTVEATAAGVTERTVLIGAMLRSLLEERFALKLHRETEEVAMYELRVAKSGFKLKPMQAGDCSPDDGTPIDPGASKPRCGNLMMLNGNGRTRWEFGGTTLENLAAMVSRPLGSHVIDRTNISGQFIVRLEFQRDAQPAGGGGRDVSGREIALPDTPPMATALEEQLGLTLQKTKGPRGFLVIDHIERPKPDAPASPPPLARATGSGRARGKRPSSDTRLQSAAPPSRAGGAGR